MTIQFKKFLLFVASIVLSWVTFSLLWWAYDPNRAHSIEAIFRIALMYEIVSVVSVFIFYLLLKRFFLQK